MLSKSQAYQWNCEPIEVRMLKRQLANLSCKHDFRRHPTLYETKSDYCEQGIQVKCEPKKVDETTQIESNLASSLNMFNSYNNVSMCPTCLVAFSVLNAASNKKVMKDQELITDFEIHRSGEDMRDPVDCGSGYMSRTTSFTSPPYSDFAFHDFSSECLNDGMYRHHSPNHEVNFLDAYFGCTLPKQDVVPPHISHAVCMDSFINSIRPPLNLGNN
ncbi:uncharacterized protein LOC132901986 [Amyelois transitella]|uniref:uncharacterized protein LOC132901986 n=1 Tax=Amyelois transitella TaxID=680683 RepID=UPI0029905FA3|nr:uncharacterized protein LOC132901986 [Amyelois transitella]